MISNDNTVSAHVERPLDGGHLWSIPDFARRYRLGKREENCLMALYGPFASFHDLLSNAGRRSPA